MFSVACETVPCFFEDSQQNLTLQKLLTTIPVNENQIHRELMGKEDVHQKQRRNVKNNTNPENPPAKATKEDGEREEQFPNEYNRHSDWQVLPHLRQPEREAEGGVVQVVQ